MKIHILSQLIDGPWGGGNQFQKALKNQLIKNNIFSENINDCDTIIINSHHWNDKLWQLFKLKRANPKLVIIHRIDGPISIARGSDKQLVVDKAIINFNNSFVDGTVFQSDWSREKWIPIGMQNNNPQIVIKNAPDNNIFHSYNKSNKKNKKLRIIATSWSPNWNKGFEIYKFLDEKLDFTKYDFTFIGNSPIKFKNIKQIKPMYSTELADQLRRHDLYITASKNDSCSNSLIEAIHCGLVPIALDSGGNSEIINLRNLLFQSKEDVIKVIENVNTDIEKKYKLLNLETIDVVCDKYINFINSIQLRKLKDGVYPKYYSFFKTLIHINKVKRINNA